ncbi:MAG: hypothetical protein ABSA46_04915 [Thermodesulfovibrionales bacterium]|jgi:hypothetical protein
MDAIAERLKELFAEISPMIESYTREVCPQCAQVCCKQRHALPDAKDRVFLRALGLESPPYDNRRSPDEQCQFLGSTGCVNPRWMRPFRCTWFFCEPLLRAMDEGAGKRCRKLTALLGEIVKMSNDLQGRSLYGTSP